MKASNLVMRHDLHERLAGGGQMLAMAASGSQDLSLAANLAHRVRAAVASAPRRGARARATRCTCSRSTTARSA